MHFIKKLIKVFLLSIAAVTGAAFTITAMTIIFVIGIAAIAAVGSEAAHEVQMEQKTVWGEEDARGTLLAVDVTGVILGEQLDLSGFGALLQEGVTYGYEIKEELIEAAEDEDISGIVLMIDSPGGTIFGSQAIADGVAEYREKTGKPVYAYIGGTAASGGYWVAAAADKIVADHGTAIGSIGVIFGPFKYYDGVVAEDGGAFLGGVVTQGGISTQYITAGTSKDIGNPYRRLTEAELASLQETVNDSYNQFVTHVAASRPLEESAVRNQLGAMIYGEQQSVENKLIDEIANKHQAFDQLATAAGLELEDYKVVKNKSNADFFSEVFGVAALTVRGQAVPGAGRAHASCTLSTQVLAFHGDVSRLCN